MPSESTTVLDVAAEWSHRVRLHHGLKQLADEAAELRDFPSNSTETEKALNDLVASIRVLEVAAKTSAAELGSMLSNVNYPEPRPFE